MPVETLGKGPRLSWGVRRGLLECMIFPEGWRGIRKGLVSQAQELGRYAERSREPWRGFKEGRDTPAPARRQAQPASPAMGDVHGGVSQGYSRSCQEGSRHCLRTLWSEEPGTGPVEGQKLPTIPKKNTSFLNMADPQIYMDLLGCVTTFHMQWAICLVGIFCPPFNISVQ